MDLYALLITLPAVVALVFKSGIYAYAAAAKVHRRRTRLYLYFLFAVSVQNLAEIGSFYSLNAQRVIPYFAGTAFYAASIIVIVLLFHLTLSLALDEYLVGKKGMLLRVLYGYAMVLEALLLFTPWLISDFVKFEYWIGFSMTRVPGPLFFLFELYATGIFLGVIGMLFYGARHQTTVRKRVRNTLFLIAIIPVAALVLTILTLLRFEIKWINASITFPLAITFFLAVTAYATHQYRLFDIQFFIPWSKVRKRKTAFYDRIRAMIAEIADLGSVSQLVNRLAETLRCPVVLLGGLKPVFATAGNAPQMTSFPREALQKIEHIVVANEIESSMPQTYALMRRHGIAAIVPFYPHSRTAASWMLLGDSFSEQVYTPLDFQMVEQLFAKMAELFLDKLTFMRTQLLDTQRRLRVLDLHLRQTKEEVSALRRENRALREQKAKLVDEKVTAARSDLMAQTGSTGAALDHTETAPSQRSLDDYVAAFESRIIAETLARCGGNKSKAARVLGLRPNTLYYKLERYGLLNPKKKK